MNRKRGGEIISLQYLIRENIERVEHAIQSSIAIIESLGILTTLPFHVKGNV
jgi:hypothetical protein